MGVATATGLARAIAIGAVLASAAGCALLPSEEPVGQLQADGSLLVSSGRFADGTLWSVSAHREGAHLCTTVVIAGAPQGSGCTDVSDGASGFGTSSGTDTPTTMEGLFLPPIVAVHVDATDGLHRVPLVPLTPLGWEGGAFGYVAAKDVRVTGISTVTADGTVIDRYPVSP